MILERYLRGYADIFAQIDRKLWNYEDGCVLIGLLALYEATNDNHYLNVVKRFVDRYIEIDGSIKYYDLQAFNVDFVASGSALFPLYHHFGEARYRLAIETLMDQVRMQPRTPDGSFWHKAIYPNQVWLDGLYMLLPLYTRYLNEFGGTGSYDDILFQFENVRKHLFEEVEQLHYHAWDQSGKAFWADPETGLSKNFWSRAIGWHLMAMVDIYALLPDAQSTHRSRLWGLLEEAMAGMLARRDPESGMFLQLPALAQQEGNYLETSASLMVAYTLLKGARVGPWQNQDSYIRYGDEILLGVVSRKMQLKDGTLSLCGICKGAGLGPEGNTRRDGSVHYYLSEEVVCDEQKGVGVCMMAYAQWLMLGQAGLVPPPGFPKVGFFTQLYDPIMPAEIEALRKERELGSEGSLA